MYKHAVRDAFERGKFTHNGRSFFVLVSRSGFTAGEPFRAYQLYPLDMEVSVDGEWTEVRHDGEALRFRVAYPQAGDFLNDVTVWVDAPMSWRIWWETLRRRQDGPVPLAEGAVPVDCPSGKTPAAPKTGPS